MGDRHTHTYTPHSLRETHQIAHEIPAMARNSTLSEARTVGVAPDDNATYLQLEAQGLLTMMRSGSEAGTAPAPSWCGSKTRGGEEQNEEEEKV